MHRFKKLLLIHLYAKYFHLFFAFLNLPKPLYRSETGPVDTGTRQFYLQCLGESFSDRVLCNFLYRGILLFWTIVAQGQALRQARGISCLDFYSHLFIYFSPFLSSSLIMTAFMD